MIMRKDSRSAFLAALTATLMASVAALCVGVSHAAVPEGASCAKARLALTSAQTEIGDTAGKHVRIRLRKQEVVCQCSGPQGPPTNEREARAIGAHLASCKKQEEARAVLEDSKHRASKYDGARVLSCTAGRCETTAGTFRGSFANMRASDGTRCRAVEGVLRCTP